MSSPDYSSADDSDQHYENQDFHRVCRYQTPRFHDRECSRYFDCPTHSIERVPSDGEEEDDDNNNDIDDEEDVEDDHDLSSDPEEHLHDEGDPDEEDESSQHDGEGEGADILRTPAISDLENSGHEVASTLHSSNGDSNVIDLTGSSPEQERDAAEPSGAAPQSNGLEIVDLTDDSPTPEAVARARAEKARQDRELPSIPASEAGPSSSRHQTSGTVSPSAQRRPATPPSPPPPIRRRTSSNNFGPAPRSSQAIAPPVQQQQQQQTRPSGSSRRPSEIVLPRWQPDAEVTICPICGTQFSVFIRKHHCRYVRPDQSVQRRLHGLIVISVRLGDVVESFAPVAPRIVSLFLGSISCSLQEPRGRARIGIHPL